MVTSIREALSGFRPSISEGSPLPKEEIECTPRKIAEYMDSIVRIFFSEEGVNEEDRDIQPELREKIRQIYNTLKRMNNPNKIMEIYLQFKQGNKVKESQLKWLAERISNLLNRPNQSLIEFATELFEPFCIKAVIESGGKKKEIDMLDYALSRHGGFWLSHIQEYTLKRPEDDRQALTHLKERVDTSGVTNTVHAILNLPESADRRIKGKKRKGGRGKK